MAINCGFHAVVWRRIDAAASGGTPAQLPSPVQSELGEWLLHPPDGCKLLEYDPLLTWVIEMQGPSREQSASPIYDGAGGREGEGGLDRERGPGV